MEKIKEFFFKNKSILLKYVPIIGFLFILSVFAILTQGAIFKPNNLKTLIRQTIVIYSLTLGLILIFTHGGMDISSGAVIPLSALVMAIVMNKTGMVWLGIVVAVVISVLLYLINVFSSIKFGLMSTISSLAIMFIARGLVTLGIDANGSVVSTTIDLSLFRNNYLFIGLYLVIVTIIFIVLFNKTKIGKQSKVIGDNADASYLSGVKVNKVKVISYVIAGVMVGIASIFFLARTGTISSKAGMGLEMDVMIALILGGMNLAGGSKSNIMAAIFGSMSYVILGNGLVIAGVSSEIISLVKGLVFLGVVLITVSKKKSKLIPK